MYKKVPMAMYCKKLRPVITLIVPSPLSKLAISPKKGHIMYD